MKLTFIYTLINKYNIKNLISNLTCYLFVIMLKEEYFMLFIVEEISDKM